MSTVHVNVFMLALLLNIYANDIFLILVYINFTFSINIVLNFGNGGNFNKKV